MKPTHTERRRTLLDISDDLLALEDLLVEVGGDISDPAVEAAVNEWFDSLGSDLEAKTDNYIALISTLESRAEIRRSEAKRLASRAKTDENAAKSLRDRLIWAMRRLEKPLIETARWRVSVAKNGGVVPVEITGDVPIEYRKVVTEPDVAAIRTALLNGVELGFAHLKDRGERLVIK